MFSMADLFAAPAPIRLIRTCDGRGCRAKHPSHGIGPPLTKAQEWYCGTCITFQPATQEALAVKAREALEDNTIIVR